MKLRSKLALGVLATTFTFGSEARAQERLGGYALDQFDPTPAGDDFFAVPSAQTAGHLEVRAHVMFDYAFDPLVIGQGDAIVSDQAFLRANVSLALFQHLLLAIDLPLAVYQAGDDPTVSGVTIASPDSVEMGDPRLDIRANLFGAYRDPFQIGLGTRFYFPTTLESDSFASEGTPRVQPQLALSGRVGEKTSFLYSASAGGLIRGPDNPHGITCGAGVGVSFLDDMLHFQFEAFGNTLVGTENPLTSPAITIEPASRTSIELLGGVKVRVLHGLVFGAAASGGASEGIGTPTARVVGMVGWAPLPERDRSGDDDDEDGIINRSDACPQVKGEADDDPAHNGCPPPDRDGDTVPDTLDACPSQKGRPNKDLTRNGCPSDYDRDGIADSDDACPNQKGVASVDPARNGCPGDIDTDLDGIADKIDACPKAKGSRSDDPSKNGCPVKDGDGDGIADVDDACPNERGLPNLQDKTKHGCPNGVRVTPGEIVILRQVKFKVAQSSLDQTVDPISDDLLTEVRDVILQHPEIETIEVQGHADDTGTEDFNQTLSQQRAEAVRKWLITRGIDRNRLVARGYGSRVPIAPNTTEEGRQANRRVQFVITKTKAK
ncbi:MAG: OmpA family protein [Polyangiaceae bacterium]